VASPAHTGDVLDSDLLFGKEPEIEDATSFTNWYLVIGADIAPLATTVLDQGAGDTSITRASVVVDEDPLFDEEPGYVKAELITNQDLFISTNIAAMIITKDTPFTCLTEFQNRAVTTTAWDNTALAGSFQVVKGIKDAKVLDSFCRLFCTNCSSNGKSGSLAGLQSIRFADFDPAYYHELYMDQFESKFWDPGLAAGSQQKCGGYYYYYWLSLIEMLQLVVPGRNLDWYRLDAAQYIHCMMLVPA
jgi:hypothetical protein